MVLMYHFSPCRRKAVLKSLNYTSYAVSVLPSAAPHLVREPRYFLFMRCAVFPRSARKNRTQEIGKYHAAAGNQASNAGDDVSRVNYATLEVMKLNEQKHSADHPA